MIFYAMLIMRGKLQRGATQWGMLVHGQDGAIWKQLAGEWGKISTWSPWLDVAATNSTFSSGDLCHFHFQIIGIKLSGEKPEEYVFYFTMELAR